MKRSEESEMRKEKSEEMKDGKRDICKRSFAFAARIVSLCQTLYETRGVNRTLANQLLRSGTSVGANIEEAQAGQSRADFVSKYAIACKEARETHYWLRLLIETQIVQKERLTSLLDECDQIVAILTTIIKKTRENAK